MDFDDQGTGVGSGGKQEDKLPDEFCRSDGAVPGRIQEGIVFIDVDSHHVEPL